MKLTWFSRWALTGALSLAGCAVGPDYHRPHIATPKVLASANGIATTNGPLELMWWKSFNEPLLDRLVAQDRKSVV